MLDKIKKFIAYSKEDVTLPRYYQYTVYAAAGTFVLKVISYIV